jgi:hypothetical protein
MTPECSHWSGAAWPAPMGLLARDEKIDRAKLVTES